MAREASFGLANCQITVHEARKVLLGDSRTSAAMILPNVRASFGTSDEEWLLRLLSKGDSRREDSWASVLAEMGLDTLLDDRQTLEAILDHPTLGPMPPGLVLYVMVRHALLGHHIESRVLADYVTALVLEFGQGRRSFRIAEHDDKEYFYLVDILGDLGETTGRRAFLLRAHLGNFALWLSGLFPDYVVHRVHRKGAPGLDYYEEMGQTGYLMAAEDPHARYESLDALYRDAAETFGRVRRALNAFSDRYLLPCPASPVDRLIRQAENDFQGRFDA
jgi:hypothetical protein